MVVVVAVLIGFARVFEAHSVRALRSALLLRLLGLGRCRFRGFVCLAGMTAAADWVHHKNDVGSAAREL